MSNVCPDCTRHRLSRILTFPKRSVLFISPDNRVVAVTNLFDGVDWYDLENQCLVDSFRMAIEDNIVTPIILNSSGSWITGGSCGVVQVVRPFPTIVVETLGLEGE